MFHLILCLMSVSAMAEVDHKKLSTEVIELRKEVELLNDEYKTEREKVLGELRSLTMQKADLEAKIRAEKVRQKQLSQKLGDLRQQMNQVSVEGDDLKKQILLQMGQLTDWVNQSLPFKKQERLSSINNIKQKIERNEISPVKAANQLWALFEDEKRLARDVSLHRQSLPIGDKMQLSEVVKLGMLKLFYKTESGQVGLAEKQGEEWVYKNFTDQSDSEQTIAFFEALKKQMRQGFFSLPTVR